MPGRGGRAVGGGMDRSVRDPCDVWGEVMQVDLIKRTKLREDGSSAQVEAAKFTIAKHDICVTATVKYPLGDRRGIELSASVEQFVDSIKISKHYDPNQQELAVVSPGKAGGRGEIQD